jgi:hypothetical protein
VTTTNPTPTVTPSSAHRRIGGGAHTEVWHRPGSRWVIQTFRADTPLTAYRLVCDYDYLRVAYAAMPDLIGDQRLFRRDPDAPLTHALLAKRFVDIDPTKALLTMHADDLLEPQRLQLAQFVSITRALLALPLAGDIPDTGMPLLPDIIDDQFRNLAFDRTGQLRLVDTNELISTAHLYELLATPTTLDLHHRRIHAKFFARLLYLEILTGRTQPELTADPLYRGYLTADQITTLLPDSVPTNRPDAHG